MERCDIVQDLLPLYKDRVASDGSQALVEAHIEDCPVCYEILEQMKADIEPAQLHTDSAEIDALKQMKRKIRRKNFIVAGVSALCVVVLFYLGLNSQMHIPTDAGSTTFTFITVTERADQYDTFRGIQIGDAFYFHSYRYEWTVPQTIGVSAAHSGINRIYFVPGDFDTLASDDLAFENARENAILVWERR